MDKINFSNSFVEFLEQTREQSKVSKYLHHYVRGNNIVARHIATDKMNYLTFRKNGTISYLPFGRELKYTDNGEWSRDGRQEGKPARVITQIMRSALVNCLNNRDLEIFSNLYRGQATDLYTIKEAVGDEILEIYNLDGSFTSCMNGNSNSYKLKLYSENPNQVRLLYVRTNDYCNARALMWIDKFGNKIIDRVYGNEEFRTMFRDYAKQIGAWKKVYDGAGHSDFIPPDDDDNEEKDFYIELENNAHHYPYIDTFCYMNDEDGVIVLTNNEDFDANKKLQDTGGGFENMRGISCYGRRGTYQEEECVWSDYHDAWLHEDDYINIDNDNYYYSDGERCDAIRINGRRTNWVLVEDCEEVECVNKDDIDDGIVEYDSLSTFTCYKLPDGSLIPTDCADTVEVFVIDGEIMGETDY